MATLKVFGMALAVGMLFGVAGAALIDGIEKSAGRAGPVVVKGLVCTGLLLGAIAGAAQVIVDAITRTHRDGLARHRDERRKRDRRRGKEKGKSGYTIPFQRSHPCSVDPQSVWSLW